MIKKLGVRYRIKCSIVAVLFAAVGILLVAVAVDETEEAVLVGLFGAMFIAVAAWFVSLVVRQSNIRDVLDYCNKKPHPEYELERIEQFYSSGPSINGLRLNNEFFMYVKGDTVNFAEIRELVWIYKIVTQHRTYGINTGKTFQIAVKLNDGSTMTLPMRKEQNCDEVLAYIEKIVPYIIIGYSDEIKKEYDKNPQQLERIVDERRHEYFQQVPGSDMYDR